MFFVNQRWLGGLLTNYVTIQKSIRRLKDLEAMAQDGRYEMLPKKEVIRLERERKHLEQNLSGIKDMPGLPDALFVIDSQKEQIAVREARKLGIPVVAIVDTNCDPDEVDYVIPGNDDALRAIRLFTAKISDAVVEGRTASKDAGVPTEGEEQPETEGEAEPTYDYAFGESALGPGAQSASEASEAGSESGKPTSKSRKGPNAESGDSEHHPRAANEPATQPI